MARSEFGATLADYVVRPTDGLWGVAAATEVTFWDAAAEGTQYTDLLTLGGSPITSVVTDEYGFIARFQGPDSVTGMWADTGGTSRAWIEAHSTGSGGGGSQAYTKLIHVVASATAPADVRAAATYLCDGTADQVQIQQAIDDAQDEGGGIVQLSVGNFNLTAPVQINGTANEDNPLTVILRGCGKNATTLIPASGQNGIAISNWAQFTIEDLGIVIQGASSGIVSTSVTTTTTLSFWDSTMRNVRISGSFTPTNTGWALDMAMPWRSVFENIEVQGTRNGVRITNDSANQNAGDCTFNRFFVDIVGDNGYGLYIDSVDGNMNQNTWLNFEAGASGAGCTGIYLGGTAGTSSQRFIGNLNLEQFATLINVASGNSNVFDCNYITADGGQAGNKAFVCGATAYNNRFSSSWVQVATSDALKIIEDNNTNDSVPNYFEKICIHNATGGSITWSTADTSIFRDIVAFNSGTIQSGLLQLPQADKALATTSTLTTTSTTLADISGLGPWVYPGTYLVEAEGFVQTSATTAYPKIALGGSSTWASGTGVTLEVGTSPTAVAIARSAAVNGESGNTSISATATDVLVRVRGTVVVSAAGTMRLRWRAAAAGTLTLQPGAYIRVRKIL